MSSTIITIFVRHSKGCKYAYDEFAKRCDCRKHFRWRASDGVQHRKGAGTRSWAEAEVLKRDMEDQLSGRTTVDVAETTMLLSGAVELFLQDKHIQGVKKNTEEKYTRELHRLVEHCAKARILTVRGLTREVMTRYAGTWEKSYPSTQTRVIVRARLRGFLRYCYEAQWLERIPALPKVAVDEPPTMPLTEDEVARLLAAGNSPQEHALIMLMRWTGLAIGDSLRLPRTALQHVQEPSRYRVQTARQKTGVHVEVVIPDFVAETLTSLPGNDRYFFWDGQSDIVNTWTRRRIPRLFNAAGITKAGNMTSHRLRDTFACYYLEKGVPLQDVSKMLGHESIKTTEKSYAKWVKGRQARLDSVVMEAWVA
jgi:integrase/recombinase XerD